MKEFDSRRRGEPSSDRGDNSRYAVLGLIAARDEGVHGYQLMTEVEALADDFWQLNYGRRYRVLEDS
jgi:DNA-binding PadR family transcriptional regulator